MIDIITKTALRVVVDSVLPSFSKKRWTIFRTDQNLFVCGYVFGRRAVSRLGVVAMLVLQADGSFLPILIPLDHVPPEIDEDVVRRTFVQANRRGYVARGHAFEASPVFATLCRLCGEGGLAHEREQKLNLLQQILETMEIDVAFRADSSDVTDIKVRNAPVQKPHLNPMPGEPVPEKPEAPPRAAYRSLEPGERDTILRMVDEAQKAQASV